MQRILLALTVVNLGLLIFLLLSHFRPALADSETASALLIRSTMRP